jgi:hypothetical protein
MPVFFNPASGLTSGRVPFSNGAGRLGNSLLRNDSATTRIFAEATLCVGTATNSGTICDYSVTARMGWSSSGTYIANNSGSGILWLPAGSAVACVGTATNSANGLLQLASHSALTGGVAFGTDATGLETLWRHSAGILRTAGTLRGGNVTADGYVRGGVQVVAETGATRTLTSDESGALFTNDGAGSAITFTLPSAAAGLRFRFCNLSTSYAVAVTAAAGDTIVDDGSETVTGGTITSSAGGVGLGETLELIAVNATRWVVASKNGTWT